MPTITGIEYIDNFLEWVYTVFIVIEPIVKWFFETEIGIGDATLTPITAMLGVGTIAYLVAQFAKWLNPLS